MSGVLDRQILFRTIPSCAISRLRRPATEDVSSPLKPKPVRVRLSYQLPPPPHAHTRTRMHTLARMFARFCFNVSLFALLVLLTHVVVRGAASVLYTPPCRKRAKPTNGGQLMFSAAPHAEQAAGAGPDALSPGPMPSPGEAPADADRSAWQQETCRSSPSPRKHSYPTPPQC